MCYVFLNDLNEAKTDANSALDLDGAIVMANGESDGADSRPNTSVGRLSALESFQSSNILHKYRQSVDNFPSNHDFCSNPCSR
jgi:hypothetical protein